MAIRVEHGKEAVTLHAEGEKWVIDDAGRLHVIAAGGGNIASYNDGYWANACRVEGEPRTVKIKYASTGDPVDAAKTVAAASPKP